MTVLVIISLVILGILPAFLILGGIALAALESVGKGLLMAFQGLVASSGWVIVFALLKGVEVL